MSQRASSVRVRRRTVQRFWFNLLDPRRQRIKWWPADRVGYEIMKAVYVRMCQALCCGSGVLRYRNHGTLMTYLGLHHITEWFMGTWHSHYIILATSQSHPQTHLQKIRVYPIVLGHKTMHTSYKTGAKLPVMSGCARAVRSHSHPFLVIFLILLAACRYSVV